MWGFGGRYYWGRRERVGRVEGIVVAFAWMSSQERHLKRYVDMYSSLGWNSLVCHSEFLNMFFPDKAASLAFEILKVLVEELKIKRCPIVFASFSGGPKACMYKVLQIIEGYHEPRRYSLDDYQVVRDCIAGYIYDSSPVDFTSDLGTRFLLHPTVLKASQPPRIVSWAAHSIASGLDTLFLNRFESHRAEYWQTLYASVSMKAPYLILCSEEDDLAPYQTIFNFAQRLEDLGRDVKLIKWNGSPHVGHFLHFPIEYRAAVTELLNKAAGVYWQRTRPNEVAAVDKMNCDSCKPTPDVRKAASPSSSFQEPALAPSNHLFFSSMIDGCDYRGIGSMHDEDMEGVIRLSNSPRTIPHGANGQILYDVCVPKNVEDWDIESSSSSNGVLRAHTRRHTSFNPIKLMRRSRL
ncbi:uncharacterized protein LOC111481139 isoform X1 [Cucurbita maxima]|uniref:Uncharacterized protein LOC111481139 isoform X1 n=1 Tax=Cucurbita maxima TaxID=3661 RepID=A0A6J1J416_CUCMA|nr:uncharacterized protein LOC111481139 isoform X1 [Cucurbita maxima]